MGRIVSKRFVLYSSWVFSIVHFRARVSHFRGLLFKTFKGSIMLASNLIIRINKIGVPNGIRNLLTHSTDIRYPGYGRDIGHIELWYRLLLYVGQVRISPIPLVKIELGVVYWTLVEADLAAGGFRRDLGSKVVVVLEVRSHTHRGQVPSVAVSHHSSLRHLQHRLSRLHVLHYHDLAEDKVIILSLLFHCFLVEVRHVVVIVGLSILKFVVDSVRLFLFLETSLVVLIYHKHLVTFLVFVKVLLDSRLWTISMVLWRLSSIGLLLLLHHLSLRKIDGWGDLTSTLALCLELAILSLIWLPNWSLKGLSLRLLEIGFWIWRFALIRLSYSLIIIFNKHIGRVVLSVDLLYPNSWLVRVLFRFT